VLTTPGTGPLQGRAEDIGGGGLLFVTQRHAFGTAIGTTGEVAFELIGEKFTLPVTLVRRMETADRCELGLAWPAANPREVDRLVYCLYKIELSRRPPAAAVRAARATPVRRARAWQRDWLLTLALGIAGGTLIAPRPVLPTLLIALLLAAWLVTAPR
jgi:hypothetical protein